MLGKQERGQEGGGGCSYIKDYSGAMVFLTYK